MTVAVIGAGLAGASAALELAEAGLAVVLLAPGPGATALTGGTIDVAAASPLRRGGLPLRQAEVGLLAPGARLRGVELANPAHPYARILRGGSPEVEVKQAVTALDAWLEPAGLRVRGDLDTTRWLADVRGAVRAADLALSGPGDGGLDAADEVALVAIPGLAGWDAPAALRALAAEFSALGLPQRPLRVVAWSPPAALRAGSAAGLAARLDAPEAGALLADQMAALGAPGRLLLFPPVLGLDAGEALRERLEAAAGCRVAELLGVAPLAVAGYRLDRALGRALERAGVERRRARVARLDLHAGRVRALELEGAPPLAVDACVLTTGRFVGGGVVDAGGALREPLADLPLYDLAGRRVDGIQPHRLVRRDYEGEQPLFGAGVRTDTSLRPLGPAGEPRAENLFAAGDLLGSFDPARDRTGLGVALLSGRRAGREAALLAAPDVAPC
ncbi:MAG: FAD-binding protein [Myxococcota bacterium]|nr:FAD-binding protein [Myxococcota bacterium]